MRLAWSSLTRAEVRASFECGAICAVAVGSLEQHGNHLRTDTDTFLSSAALAAAADLSTVTVVELPAVPYGFSPYHTRFGGTVSLGAPTMLALMTDICRSVRIAGGRVLVLVNGHGGNEGLLRSVSLEQSDPEMRVCVISYWDVAGETARDLFSTDLGSVGHAGQVETALSLALRDPPTAPTDALDFEPVTASPRSPTSELLGQTGVIGNPAAASAELGQEFFQAIVVGLANFLDAVSKDAP